MAALVAGSESPFIEVALLPSIGRGCPASWAAHLSLPTDPEGSAHLASENLCEPLPPPPRLGFAGAAVSPLMQRLPVYYALIPHQEKLQRTLYSLELSLQGQFQETVFLRFAALVLAVIQEEGATTRVLAALHTGLRLDDYRRLPGAPRFRGPGGGVPTALAEDARLVLGAVGRLWPGAFWSFQRHGCTELLTGLVLRLLRSLLSIGFDGRCQSLGTFLPLLHRLIMGKQDPDDPRHTLRCLVACIVGRHRTYFVGAPSRPALVEACWRLQRHVPVDAILLKLIDSGIAAEPCRSQPPSFNVGKAEAIEPGSEPSSPTFHVFNCGARGAPLSLKPTAFSPCSVLARGCCELVVGGVMAVILGKAAGARICEAAVHELSASGAANLVLELFAEGAPAETHDSGVAQSQGGSVQPPSQWDEACSEPEVEVEPHDVYTEHFDLDMFW
mmetsp:Transcript_46679/g.99678  ORF Transcript_46679/g.99678 Transcript_46679/m.99678 type:complete len:444 (-) Transcript_46679:35-1366(-)